jgi:hypothetical protein
MMFDRDRLIGQLLEALAGLGWKPAPIGDVVDQLLDGELLTLEDAADICECSGEKIRRQCELAAETKAPLGLKFARRWFVSKSRLLDDLEQGRIDRRRGPLVRARAEERAKKYRAWARPQEPLLEMPAQEAG